MVKTMESYYVETLSRVYVHGAPWIFKPIWAILKPLLDPAVREKVRLTDRPEELAEHVPFDHLPKGSMRGGMDWDFSFSEPDPHENDLQLDTETRDALQAKYMAVASEFEEATKEVAHLYARASLLRHRNSAAGGKASRRGALGLADALSSDEEEDNDPHRATHDDIGASLKARRDVLATKLRVSFLKLKPYIIGKIMPDRWGVTRDDGSLHWQYPTLTGKVDEQTLGMGTTLAELEENLAILEEAENKHRNAPTSHPAERPSLSFDARPSSDLNRRQQRLMARSALTTPSQDLLDASSSRPANESTSPSAPESANGLPVPVHPLATER